MAYRTRMRARIIANKSESDPGFVGKVLAEHGFELHLTHRRALDPATEGPENGDFLLLLGSGWSAYDPAVAPFVEAETSVLRAWMDADKPVLAICFGAQLASQALGGRVFRSSRPEIGWNRIESSVPEIETGPWMQWHYDVFTVPAGARTLAQNPIGPQAFSMGRLLAVQFHPEATESIVASWSADDGERELAAIGIQRSVLLERTRSEVARSEGAAKRLVEWHLKTTLNV